ncbi:MAG: sulfite exporter TauE/SafE family protein [Ignavibacteriae bacterium]|nr:sulfite exporter TauE/SafE family protein [Ignavibacteriota bacterium]
MFIITGFVLGLITSLHCVGMCGPLALAVPRTESGKLNLLLDGFLFNFGRIITYSVMGVILGGVGLAVTIAGFQEIISIIIGSSILTIYLFTLIFKKKIFQLNLTSKFFIKLQSLFGKVFQKQTKGALLILGLLNGLLPCGAVYIALAQSIIAGGIAESTVFMASFGFGTMPLLLAVFVSRNIIPVNFRKKLTKLIPVAVLFVGALLIMRGMSLGIPYISPVLQHHEQHSKTDCCH